MAYLAMLTCSMLGVLGVFAGIFGPFSTQLNIAAAEQARERRSEAGL